MFGEKPIAKAFLGIFLPPTSQIPVLVWLALDTSTATVQIVEKDDSTGEVTYKDYLGAGNPRTGEYSTCHNVQPPFELDHTVVVHYRNDSWSDGSVNNESVATIANGEHRHRWCGEVIIMSVVERDPARRICQSVTGVDLHVAAAYFKNFGEGYGVNEKVPSPLNDGFEHPYIPVSRAGTMPQGPAVAGVLITSGTKDTQRYSKVELPALHDIFEQKSTRLSNLIQLPLLVYRCKDQNKATSTNSKGGENMAAFLLNLDLEASSQTWGKVKDKKWSKEDIGNVWVVRQDRKPLTIEHMECLIKFILGDLHRVLVEDDFLREMALSRKDLVKERKRLLRDYACREDFRGFFDRVKWEKGWFGSVSPYST
jgi:hypothetical protein